MRYRKPLTIITLILITVYTLSVFLFGYPLVIDFSNEIPFTPNDYKNGDTISPLKKFDFDNGEWTAYIFINSNDMTDISKELPKGCRYKTNDLLLLKQMQREWRFIYTGGDVATVTSSILLLKDGKKVFDSGIMLTKSIQGLQSRQFGWLAGSNVLLNTCSKFNTVNFPIIIIR